MWYSYRSQLKFLAAIIQLIFNFETHMLFDEECVELYLHSPTRFMAWYSVKHSDLTFNDTDA
jgi:hypothetical protein